MARESYMDHASYQLSGFVDGVWHPEDLVELPGTSWIIVSCMRSAVHAGGLFKVDTVRPSHATELRWAPAAQQARLGPDVFDPHGIAVRRLADDAFELLVVDHGGGEAIDRLVLELDEEGPFVAAGERLVQPPRTSANAVAHLPDGGFVMTSMFDPTDRSCCRGLPAPSRPGRYGAGRRPMAGAASAISRCPAPTALPCRTMVSSSSANGPRVGSGGSTTTVGRSRAPRWISCRTICAGRPIGVFCSRGNPRGRRSCSAAKRAAIAARWHSGSVGSIRSASRSSP